MKKKKVITKEYDEKVVYHNRVMIMRSIDNNYIFEWSDLVTNDIVEGVLICMLHEKHNSPLWQFESNIDSYYVVPEKSLYWLSGGDKEWLTLNHFNKNWSECYYLFTEEYGNLIANIVNNSKTFDDIRMALIKDLNLVKIYEFALSKGLIK